MRSAISILFNRFTWVLGLLYFAIGLAYSQTVSAPQLPLPLENTAQSARAAALGSAFTAVNGDLDGLYLNPAGLASLRAPQISLLYQSLTHGMAQETLTTAFPLSQTGVLALGLDRLDFGNLQGQDMNGNPFQNPFRSSLSLGLGLLLDPDFSIGFSTRLSYQSLSPGADSVSPSTNAGVLWRASSAFRFGAFYSNNDAQSPVGTGLLKLGSSWSGSLWNQTPALITLDLDLPTNGFNQVQLGIENSLLKEIAVRVGYQQDLVSDPLNGFQGLTGGLGLKFSPFDLDYSISPLGQLGLYQAVDLTYTLSEKNDAPAPTPTPSPTLTPIPTLEPEPTATPTPTPSAAPVLNSAMVPVPKVSNAPNPSPTSTPLPVRFKPAPEGLSAKKITLKKLRFKLPDTAPIASATPSPDLGKKITALSDKVTQNPKDAEAWIALGNLYWKNGQADFAAQCFEEALAIWPKNKALIDWLRDYKTKNQPKE